MTKTIIIILVWYIAMVILDWTSPEEIQEEQEEEEPEEKGIWDSELLAYVGIECPWDDFEYLGEAPFDDVIYSNEQPKRTPKLIVLEINKPLKIEQ